jgi:transaldolase
MNMDLYLDTADIGQIEEAARLGVLGGVTTNPSLLARAGHADAEGAIRKISSIVAASAGASGSSGTVSMECTSTDHEGMVEEGRRYHAWAHNVLVKCPTTAEGLAACKQLSGEGIRVNMTLIFSPAQAILVAKAGAWCGSPFVGRLDDIAADGMALVGEMVEIYRVQGYHTKVLAASLRHPMHVVEAAKLGADIATMPFSVFQQLVRHPLTDSGLAAFLADWEKVQTQLGAQ